ncbi:rhomboid-like protein 14, mitochondrial [Neltuma alba]|uniref:rhomboid-like protein 14, mitochondrial n=1 Tax=Neltuma alba TaxID=207710 RepID=UPI0010A52B6B|nr:rhomboid-like protein 14, mitochondrial [Prosopis alba]XP_028782515.1 rhomboid-like protein 14, mitochondrial [Prosopis alba]
MEVRIGRRVSRGMLPLMALHTFSEYYRSDRKPPITAGLIAANTLIYLRPSFLESILPSIDEVWFNPYLILKRKDLKRFFLSAFYHISEPHLVYNMLSLLWKGMQLETAMGSAEFASMVAALLALSQGVTLMLSRSLLLLFDYERAYYNEYAVGFSGVLFAMKVVLNSQAHDEYTYVHGVIVPSRYAAWAELFLIQMFVPGVSFLGHLGGILAGLLYLRLRGGYSGSDPLTPLIGGLIGVLNWPFKFLKKLFRFRRGRISGRGTVGRDQRRRTAQSGAWRCQICTYDNPGLLSLCEMCGARRSENSSTPHVWHRESRGLSAEEVRRLRVERFGRR